MGIWDSFRRISAFKGSERRRGAQKGTKKTRGAPSRFIKPRNLHLERFEDRVLLAISPLDPELVAIIPNKGGILQEHDVLSIAPRELLLRFNEGQELEASRLNLGDPSGPPSIQMIRSVNGTFGDGDDQQVEFGWIGLADRANEVMVRFAESLPDDKYQLVVVGTNDYVGLDGVAVPPLTNTSGLVFRGGENLFFDLELNLGPQVTAVVPQPIERGPVHVKTVDPSLISDGDMFRVFDGTNTQFFEFGPGSAGTVPVDISGATSAEDVAEAVRLAIQGQIDLGNLENITVSVGPDELDTVVIEGARARFLADTVPFETWDLAQSRTSIEVYFNTDELDAAAATNPEFYQLICTQETATPDDDFWVNPTEVTYEYDPVKGGKAVLTFTDVTLHETNGNPVVTQTIADLAELGTGAFRLRIGNQYVDHRIVTSRMTASEVGTSFHTAEELTGFGSGARAESMIISAAIDPLAYDLEWPGALDEPGQRDLPNHEAILIEDHPTPADSDGDIQVFSYYFPHQYSTHPVTGSPLVNQITEAQKQRAREIFEIYGKYLGISFQELGISSMEEAPEGAMPIITGDIIAVAPSFPNGPDGPAGIFGGGMVIMNYTVDWGSSEFGGGWFQTAFHEIGHALDLEHSYDLPQFTIMGSAEDATTTVGSFEPVFPGDYDLVHGQRLWRPDSTDIDLYKFTLDQTGLFSAEILAERMGLSSALDTQLILYQQYTTMETVTVVENGVEVKRQFPVTRYREIAQNDDYYSEDSYLEMYLKAGTYFVGVSASGNNQYDPTIEGSGVGGTTDGLYELRVGFKPGGVDPDNPDTFRGTGTNHLIDKDRILFDGDADGVPGGVYDYWFNVQPASNTIIVDKLAPSAGADGTLRHPYNEIDVALAAAQPGDIVRIVGNHFDDDELWNVVIAVEGRKILDGQTFSITDDQRTVTFEFDKDVTPSVTDGHVRVAITSSSTSAQVAQAIFDAIQTATTDPAWQLNVSADLDGDVITLRGGAKDFDAGTSPLLTSLSDNVPYEIGYDSAGKALADGVRMEVPHGVTVMIDAGAVFKLSEANIDVGSSAQNIDRSRGALQVLGIPGRPVYFTSHFDQTIGKDTEPGLESVGKAGDWGGLVFRNNLDYDFIAAYDPTMSADPREVLEVQGIFLNYVNHADIRYGGGEVNVNGIASVYDPIHMIEARPTITHNTISRSADAAISGDPNSFADTKFQNWDPQAPFTSDYSRVGPVVRNNTIVENSVNGMYVRVTTPAGQAISELEIPARWDDWDVVHVVPENLFINGTPGGAYIPKPTTRQTLVDSHTIRAVANGLDDAEYFTLFDGRTEIAFEFDRPAGQVGHGVKAGRERIEFTAADTAADIATKVAAKINELNDQGRLQIRATASGDRVFLTCEGPMLRAEGFTGGAQARIDARLHIDPGMIVKLGSARIETEMGAQLIAEGRAGSVDGAPGYKVILTSVYDNRYGAGGDFDTVEETSARPPAKGDWGGLSFGPVSTASIDQAVIAYAGGVVAIEGGFAPFNPIEVRQATARIAHTRFENNDAGSAGDRHGRGFISPATIYVRGAQPVIAGNDFLNNTGHAISIDVNSLKGITVPDWGRSTAPLDAFNAYPDNRGPLVRENRLSDNGINGMEVRGGILTTEGVWDDTDIVHVLYDEVMVPNFQHIGGLRLQSSAKESLVVKLSGDDAGFTANGTPYEYDSRIGGSVQIVGTPGHPVVLTALADDTVGAGFDLFNQPQFDTNNDGLFYETEPGKPVGAAPLPGAWRSVKLERYSNDRNVAVVNEREAGAGLGEDPPGSGRIVDPNSTVRNAESLGALAPSEKAGDDNLRLGFQVHGSIRFDAPEDVDIYSFTGTAGTEVWIDLDWTSHALDAIVELVDADGKVLARSDNSVDEQATDDAYGQSPLLTSGSDTFVRTMDRDLWLRHDFYTMNPRDAGMRAILPGEEGTTRNYYVRVRSSLAIGNLAAAQVGGRFLVTDQHGKTVQFEFTNGPNPSSPDYVAIDLSAAPGPADAVAAAINASGLDCTARVLNGNVVLDGTHVKFNPLASGLSKLGATSGKYQLQVRLREMQEIPGSTVRRADIRYATTGIQVLGMPAHSPLLGELAETSANNDSFSVAQDLGNLLQTDRGTISLAGSLSGSTDIDWYRLSIDLEGIQSIGGVNDLGGIWATIFDLDYADGLKGPDLAMWVFDEQGRLLFASDSSNVSDDRPEPIPGATIEDLSQGSVGAGDPFIGTAFLPERNGATYYVAVTSVLRVPWELEDTSPYTRREPLNSVNRVATEHFTPGGGNSRPYNSPNYSDPDFLGQRLTPIVHEYKLSDTTLYVNTGGDLYTVDPFTGAFETDVTRLNDSAHLPGYGNTLWYNDIAMRNDGRLYSIYSGTTLGGTGRQNPETRRFNLEDARQAPLASAGTGIVIYYATGPNTMAPYPWGGIDIQALVHDYDNNRRNIYAVGNAPEGNLSDDYEWKNLMYVLNSNGVAYTHPGILYGNAATGPRSISGEKIPLGRLFSAPTILAAAATQSAPTYSPDLFYQGDPYPAGTPGINAEGDIADGEWLEVNGNRFEFDFGSDIILSPDGVSVLRDGQYFTLDGARFEFDSGPVLVASQVGTPSSLEGKTITVYGYEYPNSGGSIVPVTFEFDVNNDGVAGSNTTIRPTNYTADGIAQAIVNAINGTNQFAVSATRTGARVSLKNDAQPVSQRPVADPATGVMVFGDYGVSSGNPIDFDETDSGTSLGNAIRTSVTGWNSSATVGYGERFGNRTGNPATDELRNHGDRLSIRGVGTVDVSGTPSFRLVPGSGTGVAAGSTPIYVHAGMNAGEVATAIEQAINGFFDPDIATVAGSGVEFAGNPTITLSDPDQPLQYAGEGVGGNITGLAYIGQQMYAVDDEGGLYRVHQEHGNPASGGSWSFRPVDRTNWDPSRYNTVAYNPNQGPYLEFIKQVTYDGQPITFSGLTNGPASVERQQYANLLFATDSSGHLYAIDTEGNLQPVFANSAQRVQLQRHPSGTDMNDVRGVAFSPVDYNLWHMTRNRWSDQGHGLEVTHDLTRQGLLGYRIPGDYSMYFGFEDPRSGTAVTPQPGAHNFHQNSNAGDTEAYWSYNVPGGAYGTFTTDTFSLLGYSELDKPTLYFTYYAETQDSLNYDGARVFISEDGANWDLLATNTDTDAPDIAADLQTPIQPQRMIDEVVDSGGFRQGTWRQVRVDLSRYAGTDNLRLRFDFSTASDMGVGDDYAYLTAVPADWLVDGDTFQIDGQTFEFDLGYSLVLPNTAGATIGDGEWFEIDDGAGNVVRFEFDKDNSVVQTSTLRAVPIHNAMSTADVAQAVIAVLSASGLDINTHLDDAADPNAFGALNSLRIFLTRAMNVTQGISDPSNPAKVTIQGNAPGTVSGTNIRVPLTGDMTRDQVAEIINQVVNQQLVRQADLDDGNPNPVYITAPDRIQASDPASLNDERFSIRGVTHRGDYRTVTFTFDAGQVGPSVTGPQSVTVGLGGVSDAAGVAGAIAAAINAASAGAPGLVLTASTAGAQVILNGPVTFFNSWDINPNEKPDLTLWNYSEPILKRDTGAGDLMRVIGQHSVSNWGRLGYSNSLPGDNPPPKVYASDRPNNRFHLFERGQDNRHEGFYIDDIIIGFAERGELITNAAAGGARTDFRTYREPYLPDGELPIITVGDYQLEIRTGVTYGSYLGAGPYAVNLITQTFDTNDRLAEGYTLVVPRASEIFHGQSFELYDGINRQTFVFLDDVLRGGAGDGNIAIYFNSQEDAGELAIKVAEAINQAKQDGKLNIVAKYTTNGTDARVDLTGAVGVSGIGADFYRVNTWDNGDRNLAREKGQIILEANKIMHSEEYGIEVGPSARDGYWDKANPPLNPQIPHPGSGRSIKTPNDLVPGIHIENNLLAFGGTGGILFSGSTGQPTGAVPFGRIVNNTVYGQVDARVGVGIDVRNNASPTVINNILANLQRSVVIDANSSTTVRGYNLYQNVGDRTPGDYANSEWVIENTDPLFVDPAGENFYLAHSEDRNNNKVLDPGEDLDGDGELDYNRAIDSSIDSLEERQDYFNAVLQPIGIPPSPILAPDRDLFGQLRQDDPGNPDYGAGLSIKKDRGAIDRVDFVGPGVQLNEPVDADKDGWVLLVGQTPLVFKLQLFDSGVGIDDHSVTTEMIQVYKDDVLLSDGVEYIFEYNSTNDEIFLWPTEGVWKSGSVYRVVLDNTDLDGTPAIRDLADNPLRANQIDGSTEFTINLAALDFGDAPAPYPTALAEEGARHIIVGPYLGNKPNNEPDARVDDNAEGDTDDGVQLPGSIVAGGVATILVNASGDGVLDAWIDYNQDGQWTADEKLSFFDADGNPITSLTAGDNELRFTAFESAVGGRTFARFRFSTAGGLEPTGQAADGEVEDYTIDVVEFIKDFGDAPDSYSTTLAQSGPYHRLKPNPTEGLYLGTTVDSEDDGLPSPLANGDDLQGVAEVETATIEFLDSMTPGQPVPVRVHVTLPADVSQAYLQGWIDFDRDGNWGTLDNQGNVVAVDSGEQVFTNQLVVNGVNDLVINVPSFAVPAQTYARLRLSTSMDLQFVGLGPNGEVPDGEVEDILVTVPQDYGDAPNVHPATGDPWYPTLRSENGPRHIWKNGFSLGSAVDYENDGQPTPQADGDDTADESDEDGVDFGADRVLLAGRSRTITVTTTMDASDYGYLNAWVDFNGDGDFDDTWTEGTEVLTEQILVDELLSGTDPDGTFEFTFQVPRDLATQDVVARFRFSHTPGLAPTTPADADGEDVPDGEVEDYLVSVVAGESSISGYKYFDLNADGQWQRTAADVGNVAVPDIQLLPPGGQQVLVDSDNNYTWDFFGFDFEYFGNTYNYFFLNSNGSISFWTPVLEGTPSDFPAGVPMIAPFWADVDMSGGDGAVYVQHGTSSRGNPFVQIDWVGVGYATQHADRTNSFSLYIEDDPGGDIVAFFYDTMLWTTGDPSGGTDGFGAPGAQIGLDAGDGVNYVSLMRPSSQAELDELLNVAPGQPKYAFRFHPSTGNLVGQEPGKAGVLVHLDIDGDGIIDEDEPTTTTMEDDPTTPEDETGYYKFDRLFPDTYVVREIVEESDWVQTAPASGAHSIDLGAKEDKTDVNFGNYRMARVSVSDVVLTEGNSGTTEVQVTLTLTNSFGAPVTVYYHTQDGTATAATGDYQEVVNGSYTFTPQAPPAESWEKFSLTKNAQHDYDYQVAGDLVVWEGFDGNDWEIFFFDGVETHQLTNNTVDDRYAGVYAVDENGEEKEYIVWSQKVDGKDFEIMLDDGDPDTPPVQLTNNDRDDVKPRASDGYITWLGTRADNTQDVFVYKTATGTIANLSNNNRADYEPQISGSYVVWAGHDGLDQEIYFWNGANWDGSKESEAQLLVRRLTNNIRLDQWPQIDGDMIVWEGFDGQDSEIFFYQIGVTPVPRQLTNDSDGTSDTQPQISGNNIVWTRTPNGPDSAEIAWYNPTIHTTFDDMENRLTHNFVPDTSPRISGDHVVWHRRVSTNPVDYEVYYYNLDTQTLASNVSQSAGYDWYPQVSDEYVVWRNNDGNDYEVVIARRTEVQAKHTITLLVNGDTTFELDEFFDVIFTGTNGLAYLVDAEGQIQTQLQSRVDILNDDGNLDYGDAPEPNYPTLLSSNGARHRIEPGFHLGSRVDAEGNGHPSANAIGDDSQTFDDEDGVVFDTPLAPGTTARITVTASQPGHLDAWIDFNADGDWDDAGEKLVFQNYAGLQSGANALTFSVPQSAKLGETFARFRYSRDGGLSYFGTAANGEVEDYAVSIVESASGVFLANRTVTAVGSEQGDVFSFTGGDTLVVTLNGQRHEFAAQDVDKVIFEGQGGNDQATLVGTAEDEQLVASPGSATFTGPNLEVIVNSAETLTVDGAGGIGDVVEIYDSPGDDTVTTSPGSFAIAGPGYSVTARNFEVGYAHATAGGTDAAFLYDSPGDDFYAADPSFGRLLAGGTDYRVNSFEYVHAFGKNGGFDKARLNGSTGNDVFVTNGRDSSLYSYEEGIYFHRTWYFEDIVADGRDGGYDFTLMRSTDGNDVFTGSRTIVSFNTGDVSNRARNFELINVFGRGGGHDVATLYGYGGDDTFEGTPNYGWMYGNRFDMRARGFDYVHTYAGAGGYDVARLIGSDGDETFEGSPQRSILSGPGYKHEVERFHRVDVDGAGGLNDMAFLYDSEGDDHLEASGNQATVSTADLAFVYSIEHFESAKAKSSAGKNTKNIEAIDFLLDHDEWL